MNEQEKKLEELVKKHMILLGPGVALSVARKTAGAAFAEDGSILRIERDSKEAFDETAKHYVLFVGEASRIVCRSLTSEHKNTA